MAETVGLAVGVISLGLQVCGGITNYIDALQGRDEELSFLTFQSDQLRGLLRSVQDKTGRFNPDRIESARTAIQSVVSCQGDLKTIEKLLVDLSGCPVTTGSKDMMDKVKQRVKILAYPFRRGQYDQIQGRLGKIIHVLQLALQDIELCLSSSTNESVQVIEGYTGDIRGDVAHMRSDVETLVENTTQILARVGINHDISTPQGHFQAVGQLAARPSSLKMMCQEMETSSPITLRSSGAWAKPCGCPRRRVRQKRRVDWRFFSAWDETDSALDHLPGCHFFNANAGYNRRVIGLRSTVIKAISLSFSIATGAGQFSFSPSIVAYNTVDAGKAPAFLLLEHVKWGLEYSPKDKPHVKSRIIDEAIRKLAEIFRLGRGAPTDVDNQNNSLLHHAARIFDHSGEFRSYRRGGLRFGGHAVDTGDFDEILQICRALVIAGAPTQLHNVDEELPFHQAMDHNSWSRQGRVRDVFDPWGGDLSLSYSYTPQSDIPLVKVVWDLIPEMARSPDLALDLGFGPLVIAVLKNDTDEMAHLIEKHPQSLDEYGPFPTTPLHVATWNPETLSTMLTLADPKLLNKTDGQGLDVLSYALARCWSEGGLHSSGRADHVCSTRILLEAGCPIIIDAKFPPILPGGPETMGCFEFFLAELKSRRDALKALALQHLPPSKISGFKLDRPWTIDVHGLEVHRMLFQLKIDVPDRIAVDASFLSGGFDAEKRYIVDAYSSRDAYHIAEDMTLYERFYQPRHWDLLYGYGFRELFCNKYGANLGQTRVQWAREHHSDLQWPGKGEDGADIILDPFIAPYILGMPFYRFSSRTKSHTDSDPSESLLRDSLRLDSLDQCHCPCSLQGCSPFSTLLRITTSRITFLMDGMKGVEKDLGEFLDACDAIYGRLWGIQHHQAVARMLTFSGLEMSHTCGHEYPHYDNVRLKEEVEEIRDEEAELDDKLEELMARFDSELQDIMGRESPSCSFDDVRRRFWEETWLPAMQKVLKLDEDLAQQNQAAGEAIGVIWQTPTEPEYGGRDSQKGWEGEFDCVPYWRDYRYHLQKMEKL